MQTFSESMDELKTKATDRSAQSIARHTAAIEALFAAAGTTSPSGAADSMADDLSKYIVGNITDIAHGYELLLDFGQAVVNREA